MGKVARKLAMGALGANGVDGLTLGGREQPARGIVRNTLLVPGRDRLLKRLLKNVFGEL